MLVLPLEKAQSLLGKKPNKYPITNIVDFDKINSLIMSTSSRGGNEIIFVFDTHENDRWYDCSEEVQGQNTLVKLSESFNYYYDVRFFDMLKKYSEGGYTVFLLYANIDNGVVILNATINWSLEGLSLYEFEVPKGFSVIDIDDIGISPDGKVMFGGKRDLEEEYAISLDRKGK